VWASITSGLLGVCSRNFSRRRAARHGWWCAYNFWKPPPQKKKKLGGPKNVQISARFLTTFDFDREYLRKGSAYRTSAKKTWSTTTPSTLGEKIGEIWSTNKKSSSGSYWPTQVQGHFSGDYISVIRGCCALKFLNALEIDQGYLAHTTTGTGVPSKKNLSRKFKIWNLA